MTALRTWWSEHVRVRTSTIVLSAFFLAMLVLYFLVRPASSASNRPAPAPRVIHTRTPQRSDPAVAPVTSSPSVPATSGHASTPGPSAPTSRSSPASSAGSTSSSGATSSTAPTTPLPTSGAPVSTTP